MKTRKRLTRELVEMKASGLSYRELAKVLSVTRQRVQQLFVPPKEVMVEVANRAGALCEKCGQFDMFGHFHHKVYDYDILNEPDNIIYLCASCHLKLNGEVYYCKHCGAIIPPKKTYCSKECRQAYYSVVVVCSNCGKEFTLTASQKIRIIASKSGLLFCTKKCQGAYMGKHYGFTVHPENAGRLGKDGKSKYDTVIPIIAKRLDEGEKLEPILRSLSIPVGSHSMIKELITIRTG